MGEWNNLERLIEDMMDEIKIQTEILEEISRLLRITLIELDEIKKENRKIDKKVKMKEWIEKGFNLDEAIEWWMWGFTPDEARCWKSVGMPGKVIEYYLKGFTPEQAREEEKKKISEEFKKLAERLRESTRRDAAKEFDKRLKEKFK
jgi:hypothetical protein